jgi:tRNA-modifying protein YgfZ
LAVHWSRDSTHGVDDPRNAALGRRWFAPPGEPATGYHAHRLSHGVVEGRAELGDATTLWLECNAREQHGVDFTKGCYIGQENTARMHYRDKVNWRLAVVPLDEATEAARARYPEFGAAVERIRS